MKKRFTEQKEHLKSLTMSIMACDQFKKSGLMGNSKKDVLIGQSKISMREVIMSTNREWQHALPVFAEKGGPRKGESVSMCVCPCLPVCLLSVLCVCVCLRVSLPVTITLQGNLVGTKTDHYVSVSVSMSVCLSALCLRVYLCCLCVRVCASSPEYSLSPLLCSAIL